LDRKRWQVNFTHFYALAFILLGLITANYLAGSFQRGDCELKDVENRLMRRLDEIGLARA